MLRVYFYVVCGYGEDGLKANAAYYEGNGRSSFSMVVSLRNGLASYLKKISNEAAACYGGDFQLVLGRFLGSFNGFSGQYVQGGVARGVGFFSAYLGQFYSRVSRSTFCGGQIYSGGSSFM